MDLAGDELDYPGSEFLSHFTRAQDAGLRITVHAGEVTGPESICQAIQELGTERIGHGVKAIDDPKLMDFLAAHAIGIESCFDLQYSDQYRARFGASSFETLT